MPAILLLMMHYSLRWICGEYHVLPPRRSPLAAHLRPSCDVGCSEEYVHSAYWFPIRFPRSMSGDGNVNGVWIAKITVQTAGWNDQNAYQISLWILYLISDLILIFIFTNLAIMSFWRLFLISPQNVAICSRTKWKAFLKLDTIVYPDLI